MRIYFLGTGASIPTEKRDNTSIYFETDSWNLLVDCAGSPVQKFRKLGIGSDKPAAVFLTHMHPDHIYGLPALLHSGWAFSKKFDIFVPQESFSIISEIVRLHDLTGYAEIHPVTDTIAGIGHIRLFKTCHSEGSRGIIIKHGSKTVIYTSDTGPVDDPEGIYGNADYLIHDCYAPARMKPFIKELDVTHTSASTLAQLAEKSSVKNLIPVHSSGEYDFSYEEIKEELTLNYSGNIIFPKDLDVIEPGSCVRDAELR